MSRILFFDTETTGVIADYATDEDARQPHIVQLAAVLHRNGVEVAAVDLVVNPLVPIPEEASKIHGITNEIAEAIGVTEKTAVAMFARLAAVADVIVAHNVHFDRRIVRIAATRGGVTLPPAKEFRCTMAASTSIVNPPPTAKMVAAGINRPKSPKLQEAAKFFFNESFEAHRAIADVRMCARVFYELVRLGAWEKEGAAA